MLACGFCFFPLIFAQASTDVGIALRLYRLLGLGEQDSGRLRCNTILNPDIWASFKVYVGGIDSMGQLESSRVALHRIFYKLIILIAEASSMQIALPSILHWLCS